MQVIRRPLHFLILLFAIILLNLATLVLRFAAFGFVNLVDFDLVAFRKKRLLALAVAAETEKF